MIRFSATVAAQYDSPVAPFPAAAFEDALQWLQDAGFDAAELCIADYDGVDTYAMKERLARHRLGCSTLSTGQACGREGIALLGDADKRRAAQERICQHIDAAAVLGSCVTIGLIRGNGLVGTTRTAVSAYAGESPEDALAEALSPCVRRAEAQGVILLLEPLNRYECNVINSAAEAAAFIERMGNPAHLRILWDVFHANIEDRDLNETIQLMGAKLGHIHIADSNRWFPGYGHIDFEQLLRCVKQTGYSGYVSLECLNKPSVEAVREQAAAWIKHMRLL